MLAVIMLIVLMGCIMDGYDRDDKASDMNPQSEQADAAPSQPTHNPDGTPIRNPDGSLG